eukprot:gene12260-biopygen4333
MVDVLESPADPDVPDVPAMLDPRDHATDPDTPHIPDVAGFTDVAADAAGAVREGAKQHDGRAAAAGRWGPQLLRRFAVSLWLAEARRGSPRLAEARRGSPVSPGR